MRRHGTRSVAVMLVGLAACLATMAQPASGQSAAVRAATFRSFTLAPTPPDRPHAERVVVLAGTSGNLVALSGANGVTICWHFAIGMTSRTIYSLENQNVVCEPRATLNSTIELCPLNPDGTVNLGPC